MGAVEFGRSNEKQQKALVLGLFTGDTFLSYEQVCSKLGVIRTLPAYRADGEQVAGLGAPQWAVGGALQELTPNKSRVDTPLDWFLMDDPTTGKREKYYCRRENLTTAKLAAMRFGLTIPAVIVFPYLDDDAQE